MYVRVIVIPSAKRELIEGTDKLRINVREPAERGLANARVRELVAAKFGLSVAKVRLISGHIGRSKLFSVQDET